jgi:hypothetical protein
MSADILPGVREHLAMSTWQIEAKRSRISRNRQDNKEEEMANIYRPGTYTIKLNASGQPSLYAAGGTAPLDDPQFESSGNTSFFFQILDRSLIAFDEERPITWGELESEPLGNCHHIVKELSLLILNVTPSALMPDSTTYHFTLNLNVGDNSDVLWTADGSRPLDPTIVEKPPEIEPPRMRRGHG